MGGCGNSQRPQGIQKKNEYNTADKEKGSTEVDGWWWDDNVIGQRVGRGGTGIGERCSGGVIVQWARRAGDHGKVWNHHEEVGLGSVRGFWSGVATRTRAWCVES